MCHHYDYLLGTSWDEVPHERCDLSAILSWYDLRRIFPQGGRRTTLQGGFRKEVGRNGCIWALYPNSVYHTKICIVNNILYVYYVILYHILLLF